MYGQLYVLIFIISIGLYNNKVTAHNSIPIPQCNNTCAYNRVRYVCKIHRYEFCPDGCSQGKCIVDEHHHVSHGIIATIIFISFGVLLLVMTVGISQCKPYRAPLTRTHTYTQV